jgi:hypothetical protein
MLVLVVFLFLLLHVTETKQLGKNFKNRTREPPICLNVGWKMGGCTTDFVRNINPLGEKNEI